MQFFLLHIFVLQHFFFGNYIFLLLCDVADRLFKLFVTLLYFGCFRYST